MSTPKVPEGYQQVMPYLIIPNAAAFFPFMQKVFDATEKMKMMRDEDTIMHAELKVGELTIMYADSTPQYPAYASGFFIYVENADVTYEIALKAGAESIDKPSDKDYGRSGGVKDPCGNTWWVTSTR